MTGGVDWISDWKKCQGASWAGMIWNNLTGWLVQGEMLYCTMYNIFNWKIRYTFLWYQTKETYSVWNTVTNAWSIIETKHSTVEQLVLQAQLLKSPTKKIFSVTWDCESEIGQRQVRLATYQDTPDNQKLQWRVKEMNSSLHHHCDWCRLESGICSDARERKWWEREGSNCAIVPHDLQSFGVCPMEKSNSSELSLITLPYYCMLHYIINSKDSQNAWGAAGLKFHRSMFKPNKLFILEGIVRSDFCHP